MSSIVPSLETYSQLSDEDKLLILKELYDSHEKTVKDLKAEIETLKETLRSSMTVLRFDHPDFEKVAKSIQAVCKKSDVS
jgi:TRAP-type C4-dicarboxylate transport system substrate-binding protein